VNALRGQLCCGHGRIDMGGPWLIVRVYINRLVTFVAVRVVTQVEQESTMYLREACSSNSRENFRHFCF